MSRQSGRQDADGRTKGLGRSKKDNPIPIGRSNGRFWLNLTVPRPTSSRRLSEPCPYGHSCATKRTQVCRPAGAGLPANGHRNARKPPKGPRKQERPTPAPKKQKSAPGGRYMKNMPPDVAEVGVGHPGCAGGISPQEGSLTTGHSISLPFLDKAHPIGHKQFLQVAHLGDQFPALVGVFHHHAL